MTRLSTGRRRADAIACLSESGPEYALLLAAGCALALAYAPDGSSSPILLCAGVAAALAAGHLAAYWTHRWVHEVPALRVLSAAHMRHHRGTIGSAPETAPDRALEFCTNLTNSGAGVAAAALLLDARPDARLTRLLVPRIARPPLAICAPLAPALLAHALMYAFAHVFVLHDTRGSVHAAHHANDALGRRPDCNFAPDLMDACFGTKRVGEPFARDISGEAVCAAAAAVAAGLLLRDLLAKKTTG
jgi:hypothetical protein